MDMASGNVPEWQSKQIESDTELRAERQKLERLEGELDQLSKDFDRQFKLHRTDKISC